MDRDSRNGVDAAEREQAERGRSLVAEAVADVRAPLELRLRLDAQRAGAAGARRRRRVALVGAPAGAAALVVVVAVAVLPGGTPTAPTVVQAARLGTLPREAPAPVVERRAPALLRAGVDGVRFPNWDAFEWPARGQRADRLGGRDVRTVFYATRRGALIAYSIVAGDALAAPSGGRAHVRGGVRLRSLRAAGRIVVTWRRQGHTCVMTAPASVSLDRLLEAAAWKDRGGAVRF